MSARPAAALLLALAAAAPGAGGPAAGELPARIATPYPLARDLQPGDVYMGVRLLGALKLDPAFVDGRQLTGLSGLAWDADEGRLYALSDRGAVFHLTLTFDGDGLLADARALAAYPLKDEHGRPLTGRHADSEGLVARHTDNGIRGDSELAVSFERVHRVLRYSPQGEIRGAVALPPALGAHARYRSANRALEALAWHPRLGYLTAPELPFEGVNDGHVELHALSPPRHWRYPLAPEPNAGLTAMVALTDGSLLTLERGYGVFFVPFISTLRRVAAFPSADGAALEARTVVRFSTGEGWQLDNFEGLALLGGGRILLVSDDNARAYQSTLLAAFQLLDPPDSSASAGHDRVQGSRPE